ncbi:hypothetical protein KUTeg_015822 [Tegillarca granosa]|uniref:F-box domain-containing protein n=1 Tax=Tegillarca granosa TaxID=220873 RepID=A0ABQ9ENU5_TEGGR|nr:hypothetical protein KUTeg_015822 [Tegillarca granosa]
MIYQTEDDDEEEGEEYGWMDLPEILLEDIFCLLTPKYRHYASQVCRRWYETFYAPRVWETFVLNSVTLTKRRFNIFKGYQRELCPRKTQVCLSRVGHLFKKIIINPLSDYYNLYEFLRILASFLGYFDEYPMPLLHTLDFTFACETRGISGVIVHGTGGKILEELKILLANLKHLKRLKLSQLLLDESEVSGLLEAVQQHNVDSLKILEIVNCTKGPYMLMEISNFNCLAKLVTSPQHISDETVVMIAGSGITELHIIQDTYTCEAEPVTADAWKLCKEMAPYLRVVLKLCGRTKEELLLQPHAPVHEIHLETPYSKITVPVVISIVHFYHRHLEVFAQKCLPRVHGSRSFHERADSALVMLVRNCDETSILNCER